MREAVEQTLDILQLAGMWLQPGSTERDVAERMREETRRRGLGFAWAEEACPLVFSGPDALGSHARPTEREIAPGHLAYIDFGVKVDGYCSDLQRSFYIAPDSEQGIPPAVARGFAVLVESIERARAALRPGALGTEVDAAARQFIVDAGYEEYGHGLGHQVGRFAHDGFALLGPAWPKYGRKVLTPIEEGLVFTIEPRLFVPGHGYVSIEEMVVVRNDGAEYLSPPQRQLTVVVQAARQA
jgi:Xaa-Pro aminopeptidase